MLFISLFLILGGIKVRIEINNCGSQSVSEWINSYKEKPLIALEELLFKGAYMGKINVLSNEDIISKLFQNVSPVLLMELDNNMLRLIKKLWGTFPKEKINSFEKWSADWVSVFRIVGRLRLTKSGNWLKNKWEKQKSRKANAQWFKELEMGPPRNPGSEMNEALRLYRTPIPKN